MFRDREFTISKPPPWKIRVRFRKNKPRDHLEEFIVRGESTDISYGVPSGILCDIDNNVNNSVPGVYRVKYTLTKNLNLTSFSGQAVLIVIVQE